MAAKNSCYTYFAIKGLFDPDEITSIIGLTPTKQWSIGDLRQNGTVRNFAMWEYGRCDEYDVFVENQMMSTITDLMPKTNILQKIYELYDVSFHLEVVPSVYVGEITPCISPNRAVLEFCYLTKTGIDIDLYVFDSAEEE